MQFDQEPAAPSAAKDEEQGHRPRYVRERHSCNGLLAFPPRFTTRKGGGFLYLISLWYSRILRKCISMYFEVYLNLVVAKKGNHLWRSASNPDRKKGEQRSLGDSTPARGGQEGGRRGQSFNTFRKYALLSRK